MNDNPVDLNFDGIEDIEKLPETVIDSNISLLQFQ
jgi:hypothetical protein